MTQAIHCDVAIVGGGLAGTLVALALKRRDPGIDVRVIDAGDTLGGNHVWSFFGSDVTEADRPLVAPLVCHAWPEYEVAFPGHRRTIGQPYYSITSERLDAVARRALGDGALLLGRKALGLSPTAVVLADGERVEARGVIDARGAGDLSTLDLGWQKFVGRELVVDGGHGVERPVVMDATVTQHDGYRFVYLLPFEDRRIFVEDTYYSDSPNLNVRSLEHRIERYAKAQGWQVTEGVNDLRQEQGVLPVVIGGDFEAYWRASGAKLGKAGVRAGLFQPTTGYSLPDAVRLAQAIAASRDLSGAALHDLTYVRAKAAWEARGFYRMLDAMLFRGAEPEARYRILERFYRLSPGLIGRFYASRSTFSDKARILMGKPPIPIRRAVRAIASAR